MSDFKRVGSVVQLERVKIVWGNEVEIHDLPRPLRIHELHQTLKSRYEHEHMSVAHVVPVGWKLGIKVVSARHLPKIDRAGLCDAFCRASISDEAYRFRGYCSTTEKATSKVVPKSLSPDWNDNLLLLVNGGATPPPRGQKEGRPVLRVEVVDWNEGNEDVLLGVVDLDLLAEVAAAIRADRLVKIEQDLERRTTEMHKGGSEAELLSLRANLKSVKEQRKAAKERVDAWHDLEWVEGCDPHFRVDEGGKRKVKGADAQNAQVRLGIVPHMSEAQRSCFINHEDDLVRRLIDAARGACGAASDGYLELLRRRNIGELQVINAMGATVLTDHALEGAGILQPAHRMAILECLGPRRRHLLTNPANISFGAGGDVGRGRLPGLPMTSDSFLNIRTNDELARARHVWREFGGAGAMRLFVKVDVTVRAFRARDLPKMDKVGSCDPYVKVTVGGESSYSRVLFNTLNPDFGGEEVEVGMQSMADTLTVAVWDFDELKVLDSQTRKVSVYRQDQIVGVAKVASLKELIEKGELGRQTYNLYDEEGQVIEGNKHVHRRRGEKAPLARIDLAFTVVPKHLREDAPLEEEAPDSDAASSQAMFKSSASVATRPETGGTGASRETGGTTPEGKLYEIFIQFAKGGRALKQGGKEMSNEAAAITEGDRAYLMDLVEFTVALKALGYLPDLFSKMEAAELFFAAKGGGKKAKMGDRQLDLDEFINAAKIMADRLGKSLMQICDGPHGESWNVEDDVGEGATGWRREFPMHAAAADGNTGKFERVFNRLKKLEEKALSQAQGKSRDIPYLVAKLLKKRRRTEFRISVKSGNTGPAAPPWAQSSTNMGLVNAFDTGGWSCLHHAVCRGHIDLVLRMCVLGFEVNRVNKFWHRTPLHIAVDRNDIEMVRLLLQLGADWTIPDVEGVTPFGICSSELLRALSSSTLVLDADGTMVPAVTEENEKRVCIETIRLDRTRAVFPCRPGMCRHIFVGSPPQRDLLFPWHKIESQNADSVFEIVTREYDSAAGGRPDGDIKDETTNGGLDMPLTVSDFNSFRNVMKGRYPPSTRHASFLHVVHLQDGPDPISRGHVECGPKNTLMTRKEVLDSIRQALRIKAPTDVFYIVYSGSAQKYSGRWVCLDGYIDLYDIMKIWTVSLARAPQNDGFPLKGTRVIMIIDAPMSGMWVKQFSAIRRGVAPKPIHGPFPYCFPFPHVTPADPTGKRHAAALKRAAPRGSPGRVQKQVAPEDSSDSVAMREASKDPNAPPYEWVEASLTMAVMASCGEFERAMENALGGCFLSKWATHGIQGKMRLSGIELCNPPLQVAGTACRQHPVTCVGWCAIPESQDPRLVHIAQGVYMTGSDFFHEDGTGGVRTSKKELKKKRGY